MVDGAILHTLHSFTCIPSRGGDTGGGGKGGSGTSTFHSEGAEPPHFWNTDMYYHWQRANVAVLASSICFARPTNILHSPSYCASGIKSTQSCN